MNKDHRSAGLRWSLILSGGSLGGHGSSLGFICSCFVFSITFPIMACVAADIFMKYLPYLMVNRENQLPCVMMMVWRVVLFALKKHSISASSTAPKEGKKVSYV
jgi:hypothetical protein